MPVPAAAIRAMDMTRRLALRRQGFVHVLLKLAIVFSFGALVAQGLLLLRDYFQAHPDHEPLVTTILLKAGSWGLFFSLGCYAVTWLGAQLKVPRKFLRPIDVAGNTVLGTLLGSVVLALIGIFFLIAYTFLRVILTVIFNVLSFGAAWAYDGIASATAGLFGG